jgi:hypothetical protein
MIELPWKKVDSRIQECISWQTLGPLRATPGLTQEIVDLQPVNVKLRVRMTILFLRELLLISILGSVLS